MAINLIQFGLNWSLSADSAVAIPADFAMRVNRATLAGGPVIGSRIAFTGVSPNTYTVGKKLGGGTYGTVYDCVRASDGLAAAIKVAKDVELYDLIKESLIQIIIVETTKYKKHPDIDYDGPYAPILYDIAYDAATKTGFIVSQTMRATVSGMLYARKGLDADLRLATNLLMIQISTILADLYKTLGFNHRDFKSDNCMYIRDATGRVQVRLIDFGFSYIKYHKLSISCSRFNYSSLPSRDMTQFMYELYKYHEYLPADVKEVLQNMLTFKRGRSVCKMYKGCGLTTWKNTYDFLNSDKVTNPNGRAEVVRRVFLKFAQGLDYKTELEWAPGMKGLFVAKPAVPVKSPPKKIYNPDTGKYVLITGVVGRALMRQIEEAKPADRAAVAAGLGVKLCPADKPDRNPKTKRCVKACPAGKKRDATFKCVSASRRVVVAPKKRAATKKIPAKAKAVTPGKPWVCAESKPNYNPKTKRCVKACPPGKKRDASFKCVKATA